MPTTTDLRLLLRHPVDFEVAEDPADSRFVFRAPDGEQRVTATEAIGALSQGIRTMNADASVRAWATPAILALRLMASGRLAAPDSTAASHLQDAARAIGPDPASAQAKVRGFLSALAVDAPAVATQPQDLGAGTPGRPGSSASATSRDGVAPPPLVERAPVRPRHFSGQLVVTFRAAEDSDDPDRPVADVRLRVKPLDAAWAAVDVAEIWRKEDHHFGPGSRPGVRTLITTAAAAWPVLTRLLGRLDTGSVPVTAAEIGELGRTRVSSLLRAYRMEVLWPDGLVRELDARPTVRRVGEAMPHDRPRAFARAQVFRFDWNLALGDETLTSAELDLLAESQHGLVQLRDRWVLVDPARTRAMLEHRSQEITALEALRAAVTGEVEVDDVRTQVDTEGWLDDVRQRLAHQGSRDPVEPSPRLAGTLREYQRDGLRWMAQLVDLGLGGILADDMGLGKTVMLIALHLHLEDLAREAGDEPAPTLVICPASVVGNWEREIRRFAPGVEVRRHHGAGRSLDGVENGFVVTTYATLRRDARLLATFERGWGVVVADEAQYVKNQRSAGAKALRAIPSPVRLALTGTPVENGLTELWSILDWTTPGLLGGLEEFRRRWSRPIERGQDRDRAGELSRLVRPFVLRRRKSDPGIAPELPPKTETDYRVHLTREQVGLYEAIVREAMAQIEASDGMQRRGLVVRLLTQLKQVCNHPAQLLREPRSTLSGRSGKLEMLDELVDEIIAEDGAVLVFTQYAQMGHLLTRHLAERRIDAQFLHGGTPVPVREQMVTRFQAGEVPVFVLSLKAGGTGLNLTRADHVIHYDRWWNPAVEDQATDRAHRIGQTKPVQVHRIIAEGTIEESVAELIASKRALADAVVNAGEGALTELTDAELGDLVRLRR
ncbi:DEAD/DEAH box helicase [Cytobacillus oceanisediminis]